MRPGSVTANISAIQSKLGLLRNEIVRNDITDPARLDDIGQQLVRVESIIDISLDKVKEVGNG